MQSFDMVSSGYLPLLMHARYPAGWEKREHRGKEIRKRAAYLTISDPDLCLQEVQKVLPQGRVRV